jgi:hypothetical protein
MIVRILSTLIRILFFRTATFLNSRGVKYKGASEEQVRKFFLRPDNFAGRDISHVIGALGRWQDYDDWDWGRFIYWWERPNLYVRVETKSNKIRRVDFFDPKNASDLATGKVVWEKAHEEGDGP